VILALVLGVNARADSASGDELSRWTPAISLNIGLHILNGKADLAAGPILGPPLPSDPLILDPILNGPATLVDPTDGTQLMTTPFAGFDLELMTPRVFDRFGQPRLFVAVGLSGFLGTEHDVAKTGIPDAFAIPSDLPAGKPVAEVVVLGQGSKVSAEVQPLGVDAQIGVAFTMQLAERRLRIKPSLAYLRTELEISTITQRAVQQQPSFPTQLSDFRFISLSDSFTEVYHGIGPALEIELDSHRVGPFVMAFYFEASAIALLGDRETNLSATNQFGEVSRWRYEVDRWSFRAGTGVRLRWIPE
jgi:hypothetical protein